MDGLLGIDHAVIAGEVPSPFDDARNFISIGYSDSHGHGDYSSALGIGVAVVALRSKRRLPKRVILNVDGQFGSGQATSESEYIQSCGSKTRCLAGSSGSNAAKE
jgi:hypothetical protein